MLIWRLGPVLGPIIGGYIAQSITWRWVFWLAAILAGAIEAFFILFLKETYKVKILREKAKACRKATKDSRFHSEYDTKFNASTFITESLVRPFRMVALSPIILLLSLYVSVVFAYTYILFTNMTEVFQSRYGFTTGQASLTFIGLGKTNDLSYHQIHEIANNTKVSGSS